MKPQELAKEVAKRRTFAIISHPDAGKTTITEQLLLFGGVIREAGTVKGRKSGHFAKSDWMEIEKKRGISVTSSVMQFNYQGPRICSSAANSIIRANALIFWIPLGMKIFLKIPIGP